MDNIIDIWCDGSAQMDGRPKAPGAWAFVCEYDSSLECYNEDIPSSTINVEEAEYIKNTTNNRMELMAVWKALIFATQFRNQEIKIQVHSDSNYIIAAFNDGWINYWKAHNWNGKKGKIKNLDLWLPVILLSGELHVRFIKNESTHVGDSSAARVHRLAYGKMIELAQIEGTASPRSLGLRPDNKRQGIIRRKGKTR